MSTAGRLQNAIHDVLYGYDLGYGETESGWFDRADLRGLDQELRRELSSALFDAIYPMVQLRPKDRP